MNFFDIQPGDLMCYNSRNHSAFYLVTKCALGKFTDKMDSISLVGLSLVDGRMLEITWALRSDPIDGRWSVWRNGERQA